MFKIHMFLPLNRNFKISYSTSLEAVLKQFGDARARFSDLEYLD
jgi:hypothetical protein